MAKRRSKKLERRRLARIVLGGIGAGCTAAAVATTGALQAVLLGVGATLSTVAIGINLGEFREETPEAKQ